MPAPAETYLTREKQFSAIADKHARAELHLSHARLGTFLLVVAAGVAGEVRESALWWSASAVLIAAYIILVVFHRRERRAESWFRTMSRVSQLGSLRLARAWSQLPFYSPPSPDMRDHPYADDLDVFGREALTQLLSPTATPAGRACIIEWFLGPADAGVLRERQRNVAALAPAIDWRDRLVALGMQAKQVPQEEIEAFLSWAESSRWLHDRPFLVWSARMLPVSAALLAFAQYNDLVQRPWWLAPIIAGAALSFAYTRRIHDVFNAAFAREGLLQQFPEILEHAASVPCETAGLRRLRERLGSTDGDSPRAAHKELKKLTRIMELSELRLSGMMYMPVQLLTMWDFHVLRSLERWQESAGVHARSWLEAAGELDALGALAAVAHDHPDWIMPDVVEGDVIVHAEGVGHPMLPDVQCVRNDVEVGPRGSVLLVTGSNMSGKSTLLRALGCNVVLAQAGAPVCATRMSLPPLRVYTSVRIRDSLTQGVSLFLAELQRIRGIVDAARAAGNRTLFYLLDEMLHGTNTAERRIAARTVIEHLLEQRAIGVITTHDLALAAEDTIAANAVLAHFTETVYRTDAGIRMDFDYTLRPGLATSTNALALLEIVGLAKA